MKTRLWLFLIAFGLIFSACDKDAEFSSNGTSRNIAHLGDDYIFTVDADNDTTSTVLIAGQNQEVGRVEVKLTDNYITVTYRTYPGWFLTETHLHIARDEEELFAQITNRAGNPRIGNFDYGTEEDIFQTSWETEIPITEDGCYVIAAHAVVAGLDAEGGGYVNLDAFAASLPETATIMVKYASGFEKPKAYFPEVIVSEADFLNETWPGWCIQTDAIINQNQAYNNVAVHSSYEDLSELGYDADFLIKLNWILNKKYVDKGYTYGDVAIAIWTLLNGATQFDDANLGDVELFPHRPLNPEYIGEYDAARINEILGEAALIESFTPECGDIIAIVFTHGSQDLIIEYPFPCYQDETAWGQGGLFEGNSWAMFFGVCSN